MDEQTLCPTCHTSVRSTDFFCFNCGANLKAKPLSTAPYDQIVLYLKSLLLPPMGFIWGMRYVRQPDQKSKVVGFVAMGLTVVIILWATRYTVNLVNTVNSQMQTQLQGLGGF